MLVVGQGAILPFEFVLLTFALKFEVTACLLLVDFDFFRLGDLLGFVTIYSFAFYPNVKCPFSPIPPATNID